MEKEEYGKHTEDLTVEQLESEMHKALAQVLPPDAIKNMPISKIEAAHAKALAGLGFFPLPTVKCFVECTFEYPPGKVVCKLRCDVSFLK